MGGAAPRHPYRCIAGMRFACISDRRPDDVGRPGGGDEDAAHNGRPRVGARAAMTSASRAAATAAQRLKDRWLKRFLPKWSGGEPGRAPCRAPEANKGRLERRAESRRRARSRPGPVSPSRVSRAVFPGLPERVPVMDVRSTAGLRHSERRDDRKLFTACRSGRMNPSTDSRVANGRR